MVSLVLSLLRNYHYYVINNSQLKMGKCHIFQNIKIGYVIKQYLLADVLTTKLKTALDLLARRLNFVFS